MPASPQKYWFWWHVCADWAKCKGGLKEENSMVKSLDLSRRCTIKLYSFGLENKCQFWCLINEYLIKLMKDEAYIKKIFSFIISNFHLLDIKINVYFLNQIQASLRSRLRERKRHIAL